MYKGFSFGLIIIFALVIESVCFSQENSRVEVSRFSLRDGLTDLQITTLFQDSKGYLWIGTENGLTRYDGYSFREYRHEPGDATSISGNHIWDIKEDRQGNIWIATGKGISRKNSGTGDFLNFHASSAKYQTALTKPVDLFVGEDGNIWVADSSGLKKVDEGKKQIVTISEPGDNKSDPIGQGVRENHYLCAYERFYVLDAKGKDLLARYDLNGIGEIHFVLPAFNNQSLIVGSEKGLFSFDPVSGKRSSLLPPGNGEMNVVSGYKGEHKLWLALGNDIFRLDSGRPYPVKIYPASVMGEKARITSLYHDRTGILWIGTRQGLFKIYRKPHLFTIWPVQPAGSVHGGKSVSAVLPQGNRVWVGTYNQGILWMDRSTGKIIHHFSPAAILPKDRMNRAKVYCLFRDRQGLIWTGTDRGMEIFDKQAGRFVPAGDYLEIGLPDTLPVFTIDTTYDGDIWIGSVGVVFRLGSHYHSLNKYVLPENIISDGARPEIYTIFQSTDTRIWIGGNQILGRIEPSFNEIVVISNFPGETLNIYQIMGSSLDTLWAVTDNGLGIIKIKQVRFSCISGTRPYDNVPLYSGLIDQKGRFWLGSKNALVRYNFQGSEFFPLDAGKGKELFFNPGVRYLSSSGEVYFGGDDFVLSFYPDTLARYSSFPHVILASARYLSGRKWNDITVSPKIRIISGNLNVLELGLKALGYKNPDENRIMYKIKGAGSQWHIISGNKKLYLTNLKNRTYRMYVRSSGGNGEWSDPRLLLTFRTRNFFYYIYVVFIVIFFMIVGLIFAYVDYRTRSLVKTNKILMEKEKIALQVKEQRDKLSFMHKNLTDSIRYAQKIQQALLPSNYFFHKLLRESFILYLPKDIVSGDFYWINEKDGKIFFTVADCTGHGVPGAFMSMIGFEILDKIINDQGIIHPDEILNILNQGIINTFSRGEEDVLLKDGMDISFCTLDKEKKVLEYAGAFHELYLIRENTLLEYRGDRVSVGLGEEGQTEPYTRHVIKLEPEDRIYLFTDGYPDQFGGPKQKKFMYRRFRHLLLSIHKLPMRRQQQILQKQFQDWKGSYFQVDDVLVIGVDPLA